jgi:hypothetical protein
MQARRSAGAASRFGSDFSLQKLESFIFSETQWSLKLQVVSGVECLHSKYNDRIDSTAHLHTHRLCVSIDKMMFWLLQKQFGKTKYRRRYFSIFVVLMLSLFVITQIHHATLQHAPLQEQQGDATTSLPPYSKRPKTKRKTKTDLVDASIADHNSNKNEGHKSLVEPSSNNEHQVALKILELVTTPKVQKPRIQKQQRATTTTTNNTVIRSRRPPLDKLVKGDEITGDVSWLLDFAILGHAKCATTFLSGWFREHPNVQVSECLPR